jgi:hypothetical protein
MTTYLYRVRARNMNGLVPAQMQFSDWSVDPATTILFTDPILTAGVTAVKEVHVKELRQAVAAMRTAAEVSSSTWNDDPIVAGTTLLRALHVSELRIALAQARAALGLDVLSLTDGTLTPGATVVKRVHIQELRDGVQ